MYVLSLLLSHCINPHPHPLKAQSTHRRPQCGRSIIIVVIILEAVNQPIYIIEVMSPSS
jgi:hypothetical protein